MGKGQGGPKTPFWHFCRKKQDDFKREGRDLPLTAIFNMRDVTEQWGRMDEFQRKPFKEAAERYKRGEPSRSTVSSASSYAPPRAMAPPQHDYANGAPSLLNEEEDFNQAYEVLSRYIEGLSKDEIKNQHWAFISTNIMVVTKEDVFIPIEMGFVKYSMNEGIIVRKNDFINPGEIPFGYASEAYKHQENHLIPLSNYQPARSDYDGLLLELKELLTSAAITLGSHTFYLICCRGGSEQDDQVEQVVGSIKWLKNKAIERARQIANTGDDPRAYNEIEQEVKAYENFVNQFLYIQTEQLLNLLLQKIEGHEEPIAISEDKMTKTTYDYQQYTACDFHEEKDKVPNCALGVAQRLTYLLTDAVAGPYEFTPGPNHIPQNQPLACEVYTLEFRKHQPKQRLAAPSQPQASNEEDQIPGAVRPPTIGSRANVPPSAPRPRIGIGRGSRPASARPY